GDGDPLPARLTNDLNLAIQELQYLGPQITIAANYATNLQAFQTDQQDFQNSATELNLDAFQSWVDAFYSISYPGQTVRGRLASASDLNAFIAPDQDFTLSVFDSTRNRLAVYTGHSSQSGFPTVIPVLEFVNIATALDSDNDGLPDEAE